MLQTTTPPSPIAAEGPRTLIQPQIPFAFAFALGDSPSLAERLIPGKFTTIAVTDGSRSPSARDDWFGARIPAAPPVTGPLHVAGVRAGDVLDVGVIGVEPVDPAITDPLLVTIAIATGETGRSLGLVQTAISAGGVARFIAQRAGGLLSFGPIVRRSDPDGDQSPNPVAALVTVRCSISPHRSA
jgi:hypothetical protein